MTKAEELVETVSRLTPETIGGLKVAKPSGRPPTLNLMVYGDSGVGKTLLAGTAAFVSELSPVLFLDVEKGSTTLDHFDSTADIDVVRIDKWHEIQSVYDELLRGKHPYNMVVLDSLTEMQQMAMAKNLGAEGGRQIDATGSLPEYKDWNINTNQMRRLVRAFRDLPVSTFFSCTEREIADPRREGIFYKVPNLTTKLTKEIPAFFDTLFYYYVDAGRDAGVAPRKLQTDKSQYIAAKCRVQGLPPTITNPTMEQLYDLLIRNPQIPEGEHGVPIVQQAQSGTGSGGMSRKAR